MPVSVLTHLSLASHSTGSRHFPNASLIRHHFAIFFDSHVVSGLTAFLPFHQRTVDFENHSHSNIREDPDPF
jgi:hypothetical protein